MSDGLGRRRRRRTPCSRRSTAQAGRLIIRGHSLDELAGRVTLRAGHRACSGTASSTTCRQDLAPALGARPGRGVRRGRGAGRPASWPATPIEAMRALTARLADGDDLAVGAAPAGRAGGVHRRAWCAPRPGEAPVRARPGARPRRRRPAHAARQARRAAEAAALDTYLVTVCDHGLNASTFAARVIASTRRG